MIRKRVKITRKEEAVDTSMKHTDFIRATKINEEAVFECENAAELDSATQTAYDVRNEIREDDYKYKVSRSAKNMRVTVSLTK